MGIFTLDNNTLQKINDTIVYAYLNIFQTIDGKMKFEKQNTFSVPPYISVTFLLYEEAGDIWRSLNISDCRVIPDHSFCDAMLKAFGFKGVSLEYASTWKRTDKYGYIIFKEHVAENPYEKI